MALDSFDGKNVSDRIKVPKSEASSVVTCLNGVDGVIAEQVTTDEFDIPPTAIISVKISIEDAFFNND